MIRQVRRLAAAGARVGESPLWLPEEGAWLWLDLQGRRVHRFDGERDRVIAERFGEDLACLARLGEGACLLVSVRGFHRIEAATGEVRALPCPVDLPPGTIFNDGKADRHGALWIGSSDAGEAEPLGRLWRLGPEGPEEVARGFVVSNGPAFSPDGRAAYFADTFGRRLLRFPLGEDGRAGAGETFAEVPETMGLPDGMTVDAAGTLWVGHWDGGRVSRWSPDGRPEGEVALPVRNVTSLAFGGEGLAEVVVTTAALFPGQEGAGPGFHGDLLGWRGEQGGLPEPVLRADWLG